VKINLIRLTEKKTEMNMSLAQKLLTIIESGGGKIPTDGDPVKFKPVVTKMNPETRVITTNFEIEATARDVVICTVGATINYEMHHRMVMNCAGTASIDEKNKCTEFNGSVVDFMPPAERTIVGDVVVGVWVKVGDQYIPYVSDKNPFRV
jgi:hypothetical protein